MRNARCPVAGDGGTTRRALQDLYRGLKALSRMEDGEPVVEGSDAAACLETFIEEDDERLEGLASSELVKKICEVAQLRDRTTRTRRQDEA